MAVIGALEMKVGNLIRHKTGICKVVSTEHVKPGKGGAFIQVEFKNIKTGQKIYDRLQSGTTVDKVVGETKQAQYLYKNGDELELMDMETYESFSLPSKLLSTDERFLVDNLDVSIDYVDGEALSINLPTQMVCKIKETQPYIKGQTVKSSFKPATLENGIVVQIPDFIESGEEIVVSTLTCDYVERAKK